MKSQRRLRLRGIGKHDGDPRPWMIRLSLVNPDYRTNLARAFERNCAPKHSDEDNQFPYRIMDYNTGVTTWHGLDVHWPHAFVDMTVLRSILGPPNSISETP